MQLSDFDGPGFVLAILPSTGKSAVDFELLRSNDADRGAENGHLASGPATHLRELVSPALTYTFTRSEREAPLW